MVTLMIQVFNNIVLGRVGVGLLKDMEVILGQMFVPMNLSMIVASKSHPIQVFLHVFLNKKCLINMRL